MKNLNDVTIVGGGLCGILLALKISETKNVTLIEEKPILGGRFFSSQTNGHNSGLGFDILDEANRIFLVKKELTLLEDLIKDSSEIFTKKEALIFKSLLDENESLESKTKIWNELSKANKEVFIPIIETLLGPEIKNIPLDRIFKELSHFFFKSKKPDLKSFLQLETLDQDWEKQLVDRGVVIRKQCRVLRLSQTDDKQFSLLLSDEKNPEQNQLLCSSVVFSIPLAQCAGMMPKEFYAPEQSRFIARVRPLSMVVIEMPDFLQIKSENLKQEFDGKDQFIFPVERARGFLTSDFRILFFTLLEYESSLQAPAVREAVARLRRAAIRILKSAIVEEQRRGARMPQHKVAEKIILLPVAYSLPYDLNMQYDLKQTKMGVPNLYCCGDSFYSLGNAPWEMMTNSIQEVARLLETH
jgi:hypothetical protein